MRQDRSNNDLEKGTIETDLSSDQKRVEDLVGKRLPMKIPMSESSAGVTVAPDELHKSSSATKGTTPEELTTRNVLGVKSHSEKSLAEKLSGPWRRGGAKVTAGIVTDEAESRLPSRSETYVPPPKFARYAEDLGDRLAEARRSSKPDTKDQNDQAQAPSCIHCNFSKHNKDGCWHRYPEKRPKRRVSMNGAPLD